MITGRDMVFISHREFDEKDNTFYITIKSIEHERVPVKEGLVRMELLGGGFKISPKQGDPNSSLVTFVYWANVGEGIPNIIMNQIGKMQAEVIKRIRDLLVA